MPRKSKPTGSSSERLLPAIAAMKFWSRFQNPSPLLAFNFAEPFDEITESHELLYRLPQVPFDDSIAYSLRISLDGSRPPIWRRILVKSVNLEMLHHIIQLVMGWHDSHLHEFEVRKTRVPVVEDGAEIDERGISIGQLHAAKIKKIRYTYDFGDEWQHTVLIEGATVASSEITYPQCIAGRGMCPLEDVGGLWHWSKLLEVLQHPGGERDEEIQSLLDRVGENYTPVPFDLDMANSRLQRAFNQAARRIGHA